MRLGLHLGYCGTAVAADTSLITEAERLGYDSVWTAEPYGSDAVTPLAYLAAGPSGSSSARRSSKCRHGPPR